EASTRPVNSPFVGCVHRQRRIRVTAIVMNNGRPRKARSATYGKISVTRAMALNHTSGRRIQGRGATQKKRNIVTTEKRTSIRGSKLVKRCKELKIQCQPGL